VLLNPDPVLEIICWELVVRLRQMKRIGFVEHSDELFKKYFKDAIYLNTIV
jgi:hypothetical protein